MNDWSTRWTRVRRWRLTLPETSRPAEVDAEFAVRLGVSDPDTLDRLLWEDYYSMARNFAAFLDAQDDPAFDREPDAPPTHPGADPPAPTGPQVEPDPATPASAWAPAPADGPEPSEDPERRRRLEEYVEQQRALDRRLDWGPAWVTAALRDPDAVLDKLPTKLARKHRRALAAILGGTDRGERVVARVGERDFSREPDLETRHRTDRRLLFDAAGESTTVRWPPVPEEFAYYKVIAGIEGAVPRLFQGRMVDGTDRTELTDVQPLTGAVRHYAVWAYRGEDDAAARSAAPELWATGSVLRPVRNPRLGATGDDVAGTWVTGPGVDRVEVYRIPVPHEIPDADVPQNHQIAAESANLDGFHDRDRPAGRYEYRIYACADLGGQLVRSAPYVEIVGVAPAVPEVTDLRVESGPDDAGLVISWTPPEQSDVRVEIYQSARDARADFRGTELDAAGVSRGLGDGAALLPFRPDLREGRAWIEIDWPAGDDRVYFIAVSSIGDGHRIGAAAVRTRVGAVVSPTIVERVDEQFLTFGWPPGADFVEVRRTNEHMAGMDPITWDRVVDDVARSKYAARGGLHLPPLPSEGCQLAVTGIVRGTAQTRGESAFLTYPGLTRIWYWIEEATVAAAPEARRGWGRRQAAPPNTAVPGGWRIRARAERDVPDLRIVVVSRQDRLPLHPGDGDRQAVVREVVPIGPVPTEIATEQRSGPLSGYVRLFVDAGVADHDLYAVLDPPLKQLDRRGR